MVADPPSPSILVSIAHSVCRHNIDSIPSITDFSKTSELRHCRHLSLEFLWSNRLIPCCPWHPGYSHSRGHSLRITSKKTVGATNQVVPPSSQFQCHSEHCHDHCRYHWPNVAQVTSCGGTFFGLFRSLPRGHEHPSLSGYLLI